MTIMYSKIYKIKITYKETNKEEIITIKSQNIKWSMNQYQRNRKPFDWSVIE